MRHVHLVATWLLVAAGLVLGVASFGLFIVRETMGRALVAVVRRVARVHRGRQRAAPAVGPTRVSCVTVGSNIQGYTKILGGDNVKYVIVGRTEI